MRKEVVFWVVVILVIFLSATSQTAWAQHWVSYEEAVKQAKATDKPILLLYEWSAYERGYEPPQMLREFLTDKEVKALLKFFICAKIMYDKPPRGFKPSWDEVPSVDIRNSQNKTVKIVLPELLFAKCPRLRALLMPALKEPLAKEYYSRGQRALAAKKYSIAAQSFNVAVKYCKDTIAESWAEMGLAKIDEIAKNSLPEANALAKEKKYLEATQAYEKILTDFPGTKTAKSAQEKLSALKSNPEVIALIEKIKREKEATAMLEKAKKYDLTEDYGLALELYESLARDYADTPPGKEATKRYQEITSDEALMKRIKQEKIKREASTLLSKAKNYELYGMTDKALTYYKEVVEKFPDTLYARKAEKKIQELSRK